MRFSRLRPEEMNADQRRLHGELLASPRKRAEGPFSVLIRSPIMAERVRQLGNYVRWETSIPERLKEFAILITASSVRAEFEWHSHLPLARKAGVSIETLKALEAGSRPSEMSREEAAVYDFCRSLLKYGQVWDSEFHRAVDVLGEQGVIDLTWTVGHFSALALILSVGKVEPIFTESAEVRAEMAAL